MYGSMQLKCQEVAKKLKKEDNSHMSQAIRMLANNLIDVKNINGSFNTAVKDSKLHTLHGILPFLLSERTTGVKEIEEQAFTVAKISSLVICLSSFLFICSKSVS